jgi:patatin-like phospholipase/acyl hydrolase
VLSIDGGGMRGTLVVAMLAGLEQAPGKPIYALVDWTGSMFDG